MKKGWDIKRLAEIAEYFIGLTYSPKDVSNVGTIVLRSSNIQNDELDLSDLVRVTCTVKKPLHVRKGDILMCSRNGSKRLVGKTAVIGSLPEEMTFGTFMTVIRSELNPYLSWFFRSDAFRGQIGVGENTMINQITKYMLDAILVPVPPLAEQQRIVAILDEAFAGLATAKANAEKNLQNARALFESHLQSVFTQRGLGWVEKRLADVADFKNGLNFTRQSMGRTLRMVGVGDFQEHSVVPIETLQSVTIEGELSDDYLIRRDDILTVRSNGSKNLVGRCMLVPDVDGMTSFSGFIIRIRFDTRAINPRFLLHYMRSSTTRDRLTRDGGGTNISNINQAKLSELPVSLPSFKHQTEIANRLDDLHEETQRLTHIYVRKLAALDSLKQSLLHQAFNGQL